MTNQKRAYNSAVNRGKVTDKTTEDDMLLALQKEVAELFNANDKGDSRCLTDTTMEVANSLACKNIESVYDKTFVKAYPKLIAGTKTDELADIVIICHTFAEFLGIDLQLAVNQKMRYNELRGDNLK